MGVDQVVIFCHEKEKEKEKEKEMRMWSDFLLLHNINTIIITSYSLYYMLVLIIVPTSFSQEENHMELKNMFARTGRHMQRYNFLGHRQVVGCIPYRYRSPRGATSMADEEDIEVLLITAQRKGKGMMFPKGGWEIDETIQEAASRETMEEAGVIGDLEHKLGEWSFNSKNGETFYEGHMFPLLVKEQLELWPEKDIRQRKWISVREARVVCEYWWMKEALELLVNRVRTQAKTEVVRLARAANVALVATA